MNLGGGRDQSAPTGVQLPILSSSMSSHRWYYGQEAHIYVRLKQLVACAE